MTDSFLTNSGLKNNVDPMNDSLLPTTYYRSQYRSTPLEGRPYLWAMPTLENGGCRRLGAKPSLGIAWGSHDMAELEGNELLRRSRLKLKFFKKKTLRRCSKLQKDLLMLYCSIT